MHHTMRIWKPAKSTDCHHGDERQCSCVTKTERDGEFYFRSSASMDEFNRNATRGGCLLEMSQWTLYRVYCIMYAGLQSPDWRYSVSSWEYSLYSELRDV